MHFFEEYRTRFVEKFGAENVKDERCPECDYGAVVRFTDAGRWVCTNYASCELSVG